MDSGAEKIVVIPIGSGTGMGGEPVGAEAYMVVVRFPPEVYSDLIKMAKDKNLSIDDMVVYACKKGLDRLG
jgi:UDP-N-acetyl-D-mannosaminuronate dehydrogenase